MFELLDLSENGNLMVLTVVLCFYTCMPYKPCQQTTHNLIPYGPVASSSDTYNSVCETEYTKSVSRLFGLLGFFKTSLPKLKLSFLFAE